MLHKNIAASDRHAPHNWEYADTAARTGATGFTADDLNKLALQLDTGAYWRLSATTPNWAPMGSGDMLSTNNLSDLASTATARTNLGLGSVDNTSDTDKPVSTAQQSALDAKQATLGYTPINSALIGAVSGVASLDGSTMIPTVQHAVGTPDATKFLRGDRVWAVPVGSGGGGTGTVECYDSAGVRDDVPVLALVALDSLAVSGEIVVGAACDIYQNTSGNFGWKDNIQPFVLKSTGAAYPAYGTTIGNLEGYVWSASATNQAMVDFHIDHDYAMGTVLYPHVHFRPLTAGAGVVRWGFEYTVSKGHGQQTGMPATTTVYVNFTVGAGNLGTHYVAEVIQADAVPALYAEPDSVIHVRVFRDATNAADTYAGTVWAWQADLHYQTGRISTLNRAPNFYG